MTCIESLVGSEGGGVVPVNAVVAECKMQVTARRDDIPLL